MYKKLIFFSLSHTLLFAGVVVPDDYIISDDENISYLYSSEYQGLFSDFSEYQKKIIQKYEKEYGYKLDQKLYVGVASNKNQIANGFSTQFPFNSQLFYGGGASYIDYFCFSSWLKTLIIHETAHNFQLNPKENDLSKISYKILGNSPFSMVGIVPLFPVPNITESSFILEGNAVLNESRFGNGGRLFSGYALAEVISLAKAGEITPELMYNQTLEFPYGEKFYLVGGFFQYFLMNRYGIDRVNSYFKSYSMQPFPFFTDSVFKKHFGQDFGSLLSEFVEMLKKEHQGFTPTNGEILGTTQLFVPMNSNLDEIYGLVSDRKSAPKVIEIDKKDSSVEYIDGSWMSGELFKKEGRYYTQSSSKVSPTNIVMGLFDRDGYLLEGSDGRVVQGYKESGEMVYFDVKSSMETPQIYIDDVFYTQSHSSVYVNKNDLYYFKQEGIKRVLYKNKKALFSYEGHYGFVSDVDDKGVIYFIAPSKHGTTAYSLIDGITHRVTRGDDVIDFKLSYRNKAVVATIGAEGYSYQSIIIETISDKLSQPYDFKLFYKEKSFQVGTKKFRNRGLLENSKSYKPFSQLKYSSLNQALSYESYTGMGIDLRANFSDPLTQNQLSTIFSYNKERTVGGLHYNSSAFPVEFGGSIYGVKESQDFTQRRRDYGWDSYLIYPFLATGYWRGSAELGYTRAYDNLYRKPLTLSFDLSNHKQFGLSKYPNHLDAFSLFATKDRDNSVLGASYQWEQGMPWQSYIGVKGVYLKSDQVDVRWEKGIELSDTFSSLQSDRATLNIPTFGMTYYAQEVKMQELSLKKVFDGSFYNYSFPLSLQRESLYFKYRTYDIDFNDDVNREYRETVVGAEFDWLFFHKITIPMGVEYLYNPDVKDKNQVRVVVGTFF
jgi:hypothetical protein